MCEDTPVSKYTRIKGVGYSCFKTRLATNTRKEAWEEIA